MIGNATAERVLGQLRRVGPAVRELMPAGGGLREADWQVRHRLLTGTMLAGAVALTATGMFRDRLDLSWLVMVMFVGLCTLGALVLPGRRLPSCAVALGLTAGCTALVIMFDGLTEAHFAFFIAVGALALYRDWMPFGVCLAATVAGHAAMGWWMPQHMYDHPDAHHQALRWTVVHGVAVLLTSVSQVIAWRLTEAEEHRAGRDLAKAEAQFTSAFEEAPVAMTMMDGDGLLLRANAAFTDWLGLPRVLPAGYSRYDLPLRRIANGERSPLDRLNDAGTPALHELQRYQLDDGRLLEVEVHAQALRDEQGNLLMILSHFLDVTEKRNQAALLFERARVDDLTGLLTRDAFSAALSERTVLADALISVVYLDLDRFKAVNDAFGHRTGNGVLRTFATRLRELCPPDVLLARLGADEFAVALGGPMSEADRLAQAIVDSCAEPFGVAGGEVALTVSAGVSTAVAGEQAQAILWRADLAMYAAKAAGRKRVKAYDDSMRVATERRSSAEHRLRVAMAGQLPRTLPVWFQPIVALGGRRIVGAEALVRLRDDDGNMVSPADFIPVAEETGLIVPLGRHVLQTALEHLVRWDTRMPYVSVNVSPRQLTEGGFVDLLRDELEASGLRDHSRLVLEVTETALLQTDLDLQRTFEEIKALGVRLALDDFGTGYSSLTWLQAVPADIVKLDRSFVAGLASDPDKAAIISAVLWLAKALGMSVIAEGVEEEEDAECLARAGCPVAQGYLFARPMEPQALDELLGQALGPGPTVPRPRAEPAEDPSVRR